MVKRSSEDIFEQALPLLARELGERRDTFTTLEGRVECELGGTFAPICGEMETLAAVNFDDEGGTVHACGDALAFARGQEFSWNGPVASLYVSVFKNSSNFESLRLAISGTGFFEVSVFAHKNGLHKLVQRQAARFEGEAEEQRLPELHFSLLPENTALYVRVRCLSDKGVIFGFRWLGYVDAQLANFGERVYLVRTFNGLPTVRFGLKRLCGQLARTAAGQAVLRRTLFLVYDGTPGAEQTLGHVPFARVIELKGPNFGGGGNSSFLVSLLLRLGPDYADAIADLLIMDDDARIDAETIIRQDAFITGRKKSVVSAAIVYSAENPLEIQEAGGYWGKFISPATNRPDVTAQGDPLTLMVYLLRRGQRLDTIESVRDLAIQQSAEYATFIFISLPFQLLLAAGAPYPFFLRNDDVDICLRCLRAGGSLAINPNLHAWHIATQNEVSEFYTILHGLLLNTSLGQLRADYIAAIFMERVSKIARAGNCALLQAHALALAKFAEGPDWHQPERIFADYLACQAAIKKTFRENAREIPAGVFLESNTPVFLRNIVDCVPAEPLHSTVVFHDTANSRYYRYDPETAPALCATFLAEASAAFAAITTSFAALCQGWGEAIAGFDHIDFWNRIAATGRIRIAGANTGATAAMPAPVRPAAGIVAVGSLRSLMEQLPDDFNEGEYLRLNPDLKDSKISLRKHWLLYGRKEGRRYK